MGSLFALDFLNNCVSNIGAVCGKTNEFSAELDSIDYFNGKKNGIADSCSIFLCDMTYRSTRNASLEIEPDKWDAEYFLFQPDRSAGAGCTQQAGYFKNGGAWFTDPSDAERGDWVFSMSALSILGVMLKNLGLMVLPLLQEIPMAVMLPFIIIGMMTPRSEVLEDPGMTDGKFLLLKKNLRHRRKTPNLNRHLNLHLNPNLNLRHTNSRL